MKFDSPLVSIIIPSYNYAHLILDTLESVRSQTLNNWECLIIDDGSNDNTETVVNNYIANLADDRFIYIKTGNKGTSSAKNKGLQIAKGVFIQFLDADDLLSRSKLAIQTLLLEKNGSALVFSKSLFFVDGNIDRPYIERYPVGYLAEKSYEGSNLLHKIIANNLFTISSPLLRHSVIKGKVLFDDSITNNEDWLFWFEVANLNPNFIYDNNKDSYVLIRLHENSAMKNESKMYQGEIYVRRSFDLKLYGNLKTKNQEFLALHNIRSVDYKAGYKYVWNEFKISPLKAVPILLKSIAKSMARFYRNFRK